VEQLAALVERQRVHRHETCVVLRQTLTPRHQTPQLRGEPDPLCLDALVSAGLLVHYLAPSLPPGTKRAAWHAYRVVSRYEQRGESSCVVPAPLSH
jgi:hypothetical protein